MKECPKTKNPAGLEASRVLEKSNDLGEIVNYLLASLRPLFAALESESAKPKSGCAPDRRDPKGVWARIVWFRLSIIGCEVKLHLAGDFRMVNWKIVESKDSFIDGA